MSLQHGSAPELFTATIAVGLTSTTALSLLYRRDVGCGHLVTVCQQAFSLLILWQPAAEFFRGRKKLAIPIAWHGAAALCSLGGCSLGNVALDLQLPLPLFFLMKCGSLVATMLVGLVIVGRRYSPQQVISVGCVTAGLMWATLVSNGSSVTSAMAFSTATGGPSPERVVIGALLVFAALVCTSIMGAVQEVVFRKYGRHYEEATVMSTLLFLPLYLAMNGSAVARHGTAWWASAFASEGSDGGQLLASVAPPLLATMACNHVIRILMCKLTASSSQGSLFTMIAISAYRFLAILLTAAFASSPVTSDSEASGPGGGMRDMWAGMALVLIGTAASIAAETRSARTKTSSEVSTPQVAVGTSNNNDVPPPLILKNGNTRSPKSVLQIPSDSLTQQLRFELDDFKKQPNVISSVDDQQTAAASHSNASEVASSPPRSPPRSTPRRRQQVASLRSSAFFASPMNALLSSGLAVAFGGGEQQNKAKLP